MGDTENTNDAETTDTNDTGADETSDATTDDESETSQNSDDNDASDDGAEDGSNDGKGDSQETDTADDEAEDDDGSEPELRKPKVGASNKEWAAWRAQEKAKKQKSGESDTETDDAEDSDDDDGLSEEDRAAFDKRIEKHLAPIKQKAAEQEVESEIATFLAKNPDFKSFEAKVRRWALHPNRAGVPVASIFYEVAGPKLLALGAKRGKAADQKANKTKTPTGGNNGKGEGGKDYKNMPLSDFGKELEAEKLRR